MTCQDRRDLMPLYVADALDAAEREELRRHLASGCVACAGSLAEAQATFAALPLALDPVAPSPDLLRRVMARIDHATAPPRRLPVGAWLSAAAAVVLASVVTYAVVARRDREALAEARVAYNDDARALLLQSALADRDQTVDQLRRQLASQQQLVEALQSDHARVIDLAGAGQPKASARLVWAPAAGRSVLLARDLTPPPPGRTYELWYITTDQKKVPAGTFGVDPAGTTTFATTIPPGLPPLAVAAVTDEPTGGVPAPTGTIQLAGKVP